MDPFQYLNQEANRTTANFSAIQQSLVQTRTMQLREQEQIFNQSLDLRKIDMLEKQNVFDNVMAQKKMGILEQQQLQGDALEAAKISSYDALTAYRNAQATKLQATQTFSENVPYPIGGSPQDYINRRKQVTAGGGAVLQSWVDPSGSREVDGAYVPDPSDPMDVETARAYEEQGGAVNMNPPLPTDGGEQLTGALFGNAGAAATAGITGGLRPFPPIKLDPTQRVVAGVAAATAAQTTPKDEFDSFFQAINADIQEVTNRQDIDVGDKRMLLGQMQADRMRGVMQYADTSPKAKDYLNEIAPERDAVKLAAMQGDEARVNAIIANNERRIGAFNPVLNKYAADGYAEAAKLRTEEDSAKALKVKMDKLESVQRIIKGYGEGTVPPELTRSQDLLIAELFTNPVKNAEAANQATQDRPRL